MKIDLRKSRREAEACEGAGLPRFEKTRAQDAAWLFSPNHCRATRSLYPLTMAFFGLTQLGAQTQFQSALYVFF